MSSWPKVKQSHLRPAGDGVHCFYCKRALGDEHTTDCVMVVKKVKLLYAFEIEVSVPHSWDGGQIEFHRNEGTWCANNGLDDLIRGLDNSECYCAKFQCTFLGDVDDTPKIRKE